MNDATIVRQHVQYSECIPEIRHQDHGPTRCPQRDTPRTRHQNRGLFLVRSPLSVRLHSQHSDPGAPVKHGDFSHIVEPQPDIELDDLGVRLQHQVRVAHASRPG